jgi:hypothetical protein
VPVLGEQSTEQHSAPLVHVLPSVLHVALSGTHASFTQLPPQHSPFDVHGILSEIHAG